MAVKGHNLPPGIICLNDGFYSWAHPYGVSCYISSMVDCPVDKVYIVQAEILELD